MIFKQYLAECQKWADTGLKSVLDKSGSSSHSLLHEAMAYSTLAGGKRIRPLLVRASCEALGGTPENALPAACAMELIHTYSLIHDDLPAMDDDDLRRGKPTCHKAFDEATAILAGDALLTLAFEVITESSLPAETRLQQTRVLAQAAGAGGMVSGQAMDIEATGKNLNLETLKKLHQHKTGALIKASCVLGGLAANGSAEQISALSSYADASGLAFQVQDDILDVTASTEVLGKNQGADINLGKNTYVSLLGLDKAREQAATLRDQALTALYPLGEKAEMLRELADFIVNRNH
ncbi:polyprenyl synthetase family protein [Sansalvadorimonas sp. 2012CJ34-2]|uniref:Polyprenyl synthetase family protein n=1 Tax=Parendozoicomonas callyspongiae TaxID=2942213 RepID=A0ABT0PL18_9GAMM|nr:farnesyl diphosphate synthase [Sansalvadorimonas sp. 2012CJ34-2]MCL6272072.1 polyprenyl synthetase family protein [Sansalvadorimonas sp. 2012CJ34-2]